MEKLKLKKQREKRKYSQEKVAELLHMDKTSYHRREKGKTPISKEEWEQLAIILDCKVEDIYEEDVPSMVFNDNSIVTVYCKTANNHIYNMPKEFVDCQMRYIELLVEKLKLIEIWILNQVQELVRPRRMTGLRLFTFSSLKFLYIK